MRLTFDLGGVQTVQDLWQCGGWGVDKGQVQGCVGTSVHSGVCVSTGYVECEHSCGSQASVSRGVEVSGM